MFQLNNALGLALIIFIGFYGAKVLRKIYFPAVTAYLILGILIGPRIINLIPLQIINFSEAISNFVLGVIAFSLGRNFTLKSLKKAGASVFWISLCEGLGAWLVVTIIMILYCIFVQVPTHVALVLGAAAAATAPAATVMVIREYRAHGPVTEMLLRVVAIDDAWCLILSAIAITIANALHHGLFTVTVLFKSLFEVIASLVIGCAGGFGLHQLSRLTKNREEFFTITIGFVAFLVGCSIFLDLSPLLTSMAAGVMIANISKDQDLFFDMLRRVDSVLFLIFFILVGANFNIGMIPSIGIIGILYIIFRVAGKFVGVKLGVFISRADDKLGKYLGWGLIPQAGVALGVALAAKTMYPQYGSTIFTTITATTVIYELLGPICTKYGLRKAGEIP